MKIIKYAIILLFTIFVNGQTEKGKFYVGANSNLGLSSEKATGNPNESFYTERKYNSFQLSSKLGYLISNNLVFGVGFSLNPSNEIQNSEFTFNNNTSTSQIKNEEKTTEITAFTKYYFLKNKFRPFALISYGFGRLKEIKYEVVNANIFEEASFGGDNNFKVLNVGAGGAYFLSDLLNLELGINYSNKFIQSETYSDLKGINASFGINLFF